MASKGVGIRKGIYVEAIAGSQKGVVGIVGEWNAEKKKWMVDFGGDGTNKRNYKGTNLKALSDDVGKKKLKIGSDKSSKGGGKKRGKIGRKNKSNLNTAFMAKLNGMGAVGGFGDGAGLQAKLDKARAASAEAESAMKVGKDLREGDGVVRGRRRSQSHAAMGRPMMKRKRRRPRSHRLDFLPTKSKSEPAEASKTEVSTGKCAGEDVEKKVESEVKIEDSIKGSDEVGGCEGEQKKGEDEVKIEVSGKSSDEVGKGEEKKGEEKKGEEKKGEEKKDSDSSKVKEEKKKVVSHNWVAVHTNDGTYFMESETRETTWERPDTNGEEIPDFVPETDDDDEEDEESENSSKDAAATEGIEEVTHSWVSVMTDNGEKYFMNSETRETTWDRPKETKGQGIPEYMDNPIASAVALRFWIYLTIEKNDEGRKKLQKRRRMAFIEEQLDEEKKKKKCGIQQIWSHV
eukprot:g2328.t1